MEKFFSLFRLRANEYWPQQPKQKINFKGCFGSFVNYQCYGGTIGAAANASYNATSMGLASNVTIEAWVKTSDVSATQTIAAYYVEGSTNRGAILRIVGGKAEFLGREGTTTNYSSGLGTTNVADGQWHHVAGTFSSGVWKVYVDGQLENQIGTPTFGNFTGLNEKMQIGRTFNGSTYVNYHKG